MGAAVYVSYLMGGKQEFGVWLRSALADSGMRQAELSRRSGVSQGNLSRYQAGATLPDPDTIKKIADALNADADELLIVAGHRPGEPEPTRTYVLRTKNAKVLRIAQMIEDRVGQRDQDLEKAEKLLDTIFPSEES